MKRSSLVRRRLEDRGTAVVELAIIAPALIALMLLVVAAGRISDATATVRRAASEAARAASLHQHPAGAVEAARQTAVANLVAAGMDCISQDTDIDTSSFRAGGRVAVTVTCVASMSDVTFIGLPGTRTFRSRAVEVVDTYRSETQSLAGNPLRHGAVPDVEIRPPPRPGQDEEIEDSPQADDHGLRRQGERPRPVDPPSERWRVR